MYYAKIDIIGMHDCKVYGNKVISEQEEHVKALIMLFYDADHASVKS